MIRAKTALLLLVLLAGCSSLPVDLPQIDSGDSTTTPTSTTTSTTSSPDIILLDVTEIEGQYNLTGQSRERRDQGDSDTAERFKQRGIQARYERTFAYAGDSGSNYGEVILSSVTVYENKTAARTDAQTLLDSLRENGANVSTVQLQLGLSASRAQFVNDQGGRNVLILQQDGPYVYYVVVSDADRFHVNQTTELFTAMAADAE